jgi:hypothetical protein
LEADARDHGYATGVPDHTGLRQGLSELPWHRIAVLLAALVTTVWLLALPARPAPVPPPFPVAQPTMPALPRWSGPDPVRMPGVLADGSQYQPRLFLPTGASVGLADGDLVLVNPGEDPTVLRPATADQVHYDGFVTSGDTLVWAESVSRPDAPVSTMLWRTNWRTRTQPRQVVTDTGEVSFRGGQHDIVVHDGRAYWAAVGGGDEPTTEVRSVPLTSGRVSVRTVAGEYALAAWPWLVGVGGGRGTTIPLLNLDTGERISVGTDASEVTTCGPVWCRVGVLGDNALIGLDVQRPDGTQRRRVAGPEATAAIVDVALVDRFVPLIVDRGDATRPGTGLGLYDIAADRVELVAEEAADVQGRDGVLWWSVGSGAALAWYALDLRTVP